MQIEVKNLLPNPFRNIDTYPIDREKIRQLRNSIRETTFWDNILARPAPKNGRFEIAYGHHRLMAIKEELGEEAIIDIPVRDLSDEDMLRIMANENMEQWGADWQIIVETVKVTREFLQKQQKPSKHSPTGQFGAGAIAAFLGKNWTEVTIDRALQFLKDENIKLISSIHGKEKIKHRIIDEIIKIKDKEAKKEWLQQTQNKDISYIEAEEIRHFENESALAEHDKEILRKNILEGRIRGKEQIREHVDLLKMRKLQEAKKTNEKKRKEELKDFLEKTNGAAVSLNNKLEALVAQFKEYPETKKYLPREETMKLSRSLTMLFITVKEMIDMTKGLKKEERKELTE